MEQKLVKVPFEVNLAKEISNGAKEGKVVTRDGGNARIICWDAEGDQPIIALIKYHDKEYPHSFCMNGLLQDGDCLNGDLMLEIPEVLTFKDGDIIVFGVIETFIGIFKSVGCSVDTHSDYVVLTHENNLRFDGNAWTFINSRKATESEKQRLIDALKASKEPKAKDCLKMLGIEVRPECEFKPFDKVLVKDDDENSAWSCNLFSGKNEDGTYMCIGGYWDMCIPYNDQTKHLLGTTDNWEE